MPKYVLSTSEAVYKLPCTAMPGDTPVTVIPTADWLRLVAAWKERSLATYYDDEGCPMGEEWVIGTMVAAEIDEIVAKVEAAND
jgi:hypothetical protein